VPKLVASNYPTTANLKKREEFKKQKSTDFSFGLSYRLSTGYLLTAVPSQ